MLQNSSPMVMKTETFYREFILQNSEGIFRIDFDEKLEAETGASPFAEAFLKRGFIGEYNPAFAAMNEIGETAGAAKLSFNDLPAFSTIFAAESLENFHAAGFLIEDFVEGKTANGETKDFAIKLRGVTEHGRLVCVWGTQRDVTAEKSIAKRDSEDEKTARLTQKIEALGRLAGGIAHDFNNFLAVIVLQNDLLNLQLPANSPLRHRTEEMKKATDKAAAMVKKLLAIGRKQTLHPKPTEINAIINEFSNILPAVVSDKVKIEIETQPDAGICFIDQNQLLQSLINLAQNAGEAMPGGGALRIATSHVVLDRDSVLHKSQSEGSFVQITVADTGAGMDAATLESAFEPFFSTKKSTRGVGLGLATVYGFVKQSKGFIWVESEEGKGTSFKIQFPRIDQPTAQ